MKICLISFDFWHYDEHIVSKLKEKGIYAHHINSGAFTHKNFAARLKNTFSKVFLGKNLKNEQRQNFIIDSLQKIGKQDQILVINPEAIEDRVHQVIRSNTDRNIAYLYDSMQRNPAEHILHYFDQVFSFDDNDVDKFGFNKINNYNYLKYTPAERQNPELDLFYITSFDKTRIARLVNLSEKLRILNIKFKAIIAGKKSWKKRLQQIFDKKLVKNLDFRIGNIPQTEVLKLYSKSKAILDFQRNNQAGLSFRVFEAMALEKKFVTDNQDIKNYDFYNPENILILNKDFSNIEKSFFETEYQKLPEEIYYKYTLDHWVEKVFGL
ncbi:glycosyltransferase family protein [Chryseobacterium foetidum]|uniref:glycosyltransferase family protein n=1 Tax=Chryseobacterium foetidum TaxID=2951057 RepID=UPI0021CAD7B1|nr:glycosyltransferase [Chryseobacterium foetidum]